MDSIDCAASLATEDSSESHLFGSDVDCHLLSYGGLNLTLHRNASCSCKDSEAFDCTMVVSEVVLACLEVHRLQMAASSSCNFGLEHHD